MATIRLQMYPVVSSNLKAIGYDEDKKILAVQFTNGSIFHFGSVRKDVLEAMLAPGQSVGQFFNQHVKGKYPGEKMTGQCPVCRAHGWNGDECETVNAENEKASPGAFWIGCRDEAGEVYRYVQEPRPARAEATS